MVEESAQNPWEVFGQRVREAREGRRWKQRELVERLNELGHRIDRSVVSRIERGQKFVSIRDLFAFAAALGISPMQLLVPLDDGAMVAISPKLIYPAPVVRSWIRDLIQPPMLPDRDLRQIPESELRQLVRRELTRGWDQLAVALAQPGVTQEVDRIVEAIRNPTKEKP